MDEGKVLPAFENSFKTMCSPWSHASTWT